MFLFAGLFLLSSIAVIKATTRAGVRITEDGKHASVTRYFNRTMSYNDIGSAQDDCQQWQDKAWPISSYWLYDQPGCKGNPHRFTKCSVYGDHWPVGKYICQGVEDMNFDGVSSIKMAGGRLGSETYLLKDHSCPPADPDSGETSIMVPGHGSCVEDDLWNKEGITVRNVDQGGNEITGDTQWIDTDYENGHGKRDLDIRGLQCKKFVANDPKHGKKTSTPPVEQKDYMFGPCPKDKGCDNVMEKGATASVSWGMSVSMTEDFIFASATEETHFDKTWEESTAYQFTGHADKGAAMKFVCDKEGFLLDGHFTECNDGQDHDGNVVKPGNGLVECRGVVLA